MMHLFGQLSMIQMFVQQCLSMFQLAALLMLM
jgi:hypothetical protein